MKKVLYILICSLIMANLLTACSSKKEEAKSQGYSVTDKRGYKIDFKEKPTRIVSLYPSTDEILFEMVDHSRLLALSRWGRDPNFSNIADKAKEIPLVATNSPEFLLKNKADIVLTREDMGQKPEMLKTLRDVGVPIYVFDGPTSISEIKQLINNLGVIVAEPKAAQKIVDNMDAKLANIKKKYGDIPVDQQKTAVFLSGRGFVGGKGTLINDILKHAQVKDGLGDIKVRGKISKETIISTNPDYIIVLSYDYKGKSPEKIVEEISTDPSFANVKAIKDKHVLLMPIRYTSCNSHYVVGSVEKIAEQVYSK